MRDYQLKEIDQIVRSAYKKVCQDDVDLLFVRANERSITHRMAVYLEPFFTGWNVDCEYNRSDKVPKCLHSFGGTDSDPGQAVFPDIIVHKRRTKVNLLVIEAKTSENNVIHSDGFCLCDACKLKAYVAELGYQFAYSLVFPINSGSVEQGVSRIFPGTGIAVESPQAPKPTAGGAVATPPKQS